MLNNAGNKLCRITFTGGNEDVYLPSSKVACFAGLWKDRSGMLRFGADESTPRVSVGIKVELPLNKFLTTTYADAFDSVQTTKRYTIGR